MKKLTRSLGIAVLVLCAGGCCLNKEYALADKATFDAVAPGYKAYVGNDPNLDADTKARLLRTIESWRIRIAAARGEAP